MTTSYDISADIIAQLVASYQQPALPTSVTMVKVGGSPTKKPSKLSVAKAAKAAADVVGAAVEGHNEVKREVIPFILPEVGSLDAKGYMKQMVRAVDRNARIAAIAGYVGYDTTISYSANELNANMMAQRTLRGNPVPLARPVHSVQPTLAGYVAGCNDAIAKKRADLQGRSVYVTEAMLDNERSTREALARNDQVNAHHFATMARLERERLDQIQIDLSNL